MTDLFSMNSVMKRDGASLVVTPRTLQADREVFLTENVCSFGPHSRPRFPVPIRWILVTILVGLVVGPMSGGVGYTLLFFLVALALGWLRLNGPRIYGLEFTLASGASRFFRTADREGMDAATTAVRETVENRANASTQITVNQNQVTVTNSTVVGAVAGASVLQDA